jgi:hypothetical protein
MSTNGDPQLLIVMCRVALVAGVLASGFSLAGIVIQLVAGSSPYGLMWISMLPLTLGTGLALAAARVLRRSKQD